MPEIKVYVRRELEANQRYLLGTTSLGELDAIDIVKLVSAWGLWLSDYSNTEFTFTGQFFIDAKSREAGFELIAGEDDE